MNSVQHMICQEQLKITLKGVEVTTKFGSLNYFQTVVLNRF